MYIPVSLILQESTHLAVFEVNGEHWRTKRISWDRIVDLKLEGNLVSGLSFDPMNEYEEWVEFIVNLEKRNARKPWWKIW